MPTRPPTHTQTHACTHVSHERLGVAASYWDHKAEVPTAMAPFSQEARGVTGLGLSPGGLPAWVPALQAPHLASSCRAEKLIWALQVILPPAWRGRASHQAGTILIKGIQSSLAKSPPRALGCLAHPFPQEFSLHHPWSFPWNRLSQLSLASFPGIVALS